MTAATRPPPALRVGITGARNLAPDQLARLTAQLAAVLTLVRDGMPTGDAPPLLRMISPLARGADRLAARVALGLGYRLHVPMPFAQAEYEKDFATADDLAEFHDLRAQANAGVLELDGDHAVENRSYEAVGRYVVRQSDLVIAIWDDGAKGGVGGTGDIVRFAGQSGVPVWWLHATRDQPAVWLADIQDLRDPRPAPVVAETALRTYLAGLITPPAPCKRHRHGPLRWLARLLQGRVVAPAEEYFAERALPDLAIWRAYSGLIQAMSRRKPEWSAPLVPTDPVARYWFDHYVPADTLAGGYARRYRSSYVWVFALGTLALLFGAIATVLGLLEVAPGWLERTAIGLALGEGLSLLLILILVAVGIRRDWHERSIEYRLLAELCRKQQALAPLGWALPITAVRGMIAGEAGHHDRGAWVAWLFAALQRAALLPEGTLAPTGGSPSEIRLLIAEQIKYHQDRAETNDAAGNRFEHLGFLLFAAVAVAVIFKIWAELADHPGWAWPFGLLATVLPAVTAASVGIRAYAELQLLAGQSHHMLRDLGVAQARVARLTADRVLVSQDYGAEAASVATLMLQDLDGWARLFRVKGVEPG